MRRIVLENIAAVNALDKYAKERKYKLRAMSGGAKDMRRAVAGYLEKLLDDFKGIGEL